MRILFSRLLYRIIAIRKCFSPHYLIMPSYTRIIIMRKWLALLFFLLFSDSGRTEQPLLKAPEGFKVELVLQAPDIEAPTALCVAPNGDVYFAEDPMDMAGPPTKNLDRIWLLKGGDPNKK